MQLIFRDPIQWRRPQADLPFCLKWLCPSRRRSVRPAGSSCYCLSDPENLHTSEGRAANVFASTLLFSSGFCFPNLGLQFQTLFAGINIEQNPFARVEESRNVLKWWHCSNILSEKLLISPYWTLFYSPPFTASWPSKSLVDLKVHKAFSVGLV